MEVESTIGSEPINYYTFVNSYIFAINLIVKVNLNDNSLYKEIKENL